MPFSVYPFRTDKGETMDESNEVLAQRVTALETIVQALADNLTEAIRILSNLTNTVADMYAELPR